MDEPQGEPIIFPPSPPELKSDAEAEWMEWSIVLCADSDPAAVEALVSSTTLRPVSVESELAGRTLRLKLWLRGSGTYPDLYDSFFTTLLKIESVLGRVESIQGEDRSRWDRQVILHKRFAE